MPRTQQQDAILHRQRGVIHSAAIAAQSILEKVERELRDETSLADSGPDEFGDRENRPADSVKDAAREIGLVVGRLLDELAERWEPR